MNKTNLLRNIKYSHLFIFIVIFLLPIFLKTQIDTLNIPYSGFINACTSTLLILQIPAILILFVSITEDAPLNKYLGLSIVLYMAVFTYSILLNGLNEKILTYLLLIGSASIVLFAYKIFMRSVRYAMKKNGPLIISILVSLTFITYGFSFVSLLFRIMNIVIFSNDFWSSFELIAFASSLIALISIIFFKRSKKYESSHGLTIPMQFSTIENGNLILLNSSDAC